MQMENDRISSLSDEILCHILSFLPTEDAFTTSFLSKRWTSLWLLLPHIDLDDQRLISKGKPNSLFPSLVFAAIFKRSVYNQPIKKLRLICAHRFLDEETLEYDFETWLSGAVEHKLEHLEIQLNLSHNLLCCIFSLRNLVVLKLKELNMLTFSEVDFPLLKSLHLNYVSFGERWFLFELLNGCPILENFEAKFIKLGNLSSSTNPVIKCLPSLVRADFSNISMDAFSLEPFCCAESLCMVEVFGGNVPVFPNLTHVHLLYFTYVDWGLISDLLKNCCNLQHFDLEMPPFFTSLFYYNSGPSIFDECLSLLLQTCTIIDFIGEEYAMKFVRYILLYSTCLQRMKICIMPSLNPQMKLDIQQELLSFPKNSEACQIYLT